MQKATFKLYYENKDITRDVKPYVLSIEYSDFEHGQSDEIQIQLEDSDNLWKTSWYPSKGDKLNLQIGYENEKLLNCGSFEIDEIEYSSPPDVITLKAIATDIKKALRQNNTIAYENKTLKQIAQEVAIKHDLTLVGTIKDVKIQRITQNKEKDLTFLKNLAEQYGYIFKITDNQLVLFETEKLKSANSTLILTKQDLTQVNLKEKTHEIYKACEVTYHNPKTKEVITSTIRANNVVNGDILKLNTRLENKEQAILQAQAALEKHNKSQVEGGFTIYGTPNLVAGLNIELKSVGNFSGKYHVNSCKHKIDKSNGYTTGVEIKAC